MKKYLIALFALLASLLSFAQVDKHSELYKTILRQDSLLFMVGFNTCDPSQYEQLLSEKFTFFHDKDGISNKKDFIHNFKNGLCKSPATYKVRRVLVAESTEIYPLYKNNVLYGAIQTGVHKFYETLAAKPETYVGIAKFTNVWLLENQVWKLTKSLSYDHQGAQDSTPHSSMFDNDATMEAWLAGLKIPTLGIGLIKDGKLQQIKVFGELKKGVTAPYNTIFNVASLTKPITAMLTLKLVSQGKWDLDEPLDHFWIDPDVAKDPNHKLLTTRHILSHQTGFSNWRHNNKDGKLHFEFTPGTKFQYSGEGFEYLRKALEHKFHTTLDQLAGDLIFKPLNMQDTRYFWDTKTDSLRVAPGYNPEGIAYKTVKNKTANAADDLLTTIEDYGTFLCSVLQGDGLSPKVFEEMCTRQVVSKRDKYFGLGFEIYNIGKGDYALSHGGADEGCQTLVFLLPKTKQGLLIFTNVDDGYKVYEPLINHYLGDYGKKIIDIETKIKTEAGK
ncbi:serine hydrolase [Taibaiella sp. KBW10]|uniref:serine hydrolase n=1 Tax=Taibaiella sp. KBW10 TaxID=2153357 RepID=UPI000F59C432|nr:serine hydrolase [Taibaiella sp. KBW10]RQO32156.1 serine hydrolase [Taibaiella sp. KBW10]